MDSISEEEQSNSSLSKNSYTKDEKRKKLITIGECSRFYLYLLGATICQLISILILGGLKNNVGLFGFSPILNSYISVQSIYTYIGYIIFSLIFRSVSKSNERQVNPKKKTHLIYNDFSKPNYKKLYFHIFLVSFCFGFYEESLNILYSLGFQLLNYWTFETIFTFLLIRKFFEFAIYKHHKCSIYFIVITCSIFLLIASLLPETSGEEELNTYQYINKNLGSYYYSIIIILFFILISFVFAFSRTFSKIFLQVKNLSRYTLIILIGINGLLISLISYIILYYTNIENSISQYFIDLNESDKDYKFYLEIFLIYPIFIFVKFMDIYFEILIIFYLNPIYALASNNLTYGSIKIALFFSNNSPSIIHFLFSELSEIFAIIGYIFFLEILELNFCGLSDNTRKNIKSKGQDEFNQLWIYRIKTIKLLNYEEGEIEDKNNNEQNQILEMKKETGDENE